MVRNITCRFDPLTSCDNLPQEKQVKNVIEKENFTLQSTFPCCYPVTLHMRNSDVRVATFGERSCCGKNVSSAEALKIIILDLI